MTDLSKLQDMQILLKNTNPLGTDQIKAICGDATILISQYKAESQSIEVEARDAIQDILSIITRGQPETAKIVLEHLMEIANHASDEPDFMLKLLNNMFEYPQFLSKEGM